MTTKKPIDITNAKPGSGDRLVRNIYSEGRHYPRGKPQEWPKRPAVNPSVRQQNTLDLPVDGCWQANQMPENFHDKNYDNDTSGWVRGSPNGKNPQTCNRETATGLPNFDHSKNRPSMQRNKGDDWSKR
jgi:hypothetical protein